MSFYTSWRFNGHKCKGFWKMKSKFHLRPLNWLWLLLFSRIVKKKENLFQKIRFTIIEKLSNVILIAMSSGFAWSRSGSSRFTWTWRWYRAWNWNWDRAWNWNWDRAWNWNWDWAWNWCHTGWNSWSRWSLLWCWTWHEAWNNAGWCCWTKRRCRAFFGTTTVINIFPDVSWNSTRSQRIQFCFNLTARWVLKTMVNATKNCDREIIKFTQLDWVKPTYFQRLPLKSIHNHCNWSEQRNRE